MYELVDKSCECKLICSKKTSVEIMSKTMG